MGNPLTGHLGPLLGQAHEAHRRIATEALAEIGLGVKEFGALAILVREGALSQRRLGALQRVDRTTTVAVVDALESGGLVRRERDPADRRAYRVHATPDGRRTLRRAERAEAAAEARFLARLSPAERRRLKALLGAALGDPS